MFPSTFFFCFSRSYVLFICSYLSLYEFFFLESLLMKMTFVIIFVFTLFPVKCEHVGVFLLCAALP